MKPLKVKGYGSIPHLPNSRMGTGDHHCDPGQAEIATARLRDHRDREAATGGIGRSRGQADHKRHYRSLRGDWVLEAWDEENPDDFPLAVMRLMRAEQCELRSKLREALEK